MSSYCIHSPLSVIDSKHGHLPFRDELVGDYAAYISSFIKVKDERLNRHVDEELKSGLLWPDPLIQLTPSFEPGKWIDDLVSEGILHSACSRVFRLNKAQPEKEKPLRLYRHQSDAVRTAHTGANYVLTTGTGSGKSLAYIVPIVDHVLREGSGQGSRPSSFTL